MSVIHLQQAFLHQTEIMRPCVFVNNSPFFTYLNLYCIAIPFELCRDIYFHVFLLALLYRGLPQLKLQVYEISAYWEFYLFCFID